MIRTLALTTLVSLSLVACGGGDKKKGADPSVAEANKIYKERCETCHGPGGKGDGPGAAALDPKPRTFANAAWQNATSDERIKKVIVEGGKANGLSESMAPNPDLKDKPEVLAALVKKVRKFQQ